MLSTIWLVLLLQSFVSCLAAPHEIFFDVDSMEDPGLTRSYNWGQRPERSQNGNATMSFEFNGALRPPSLPMPSLKLSYTQEPA